MKLKVFDYDFPIHIFRIVNLKDCLVKEELLFGREREKKRGEIVCESGGRGGGGMGLRHADLFMWDE